MGRGKSDELRMQSKGRNMLKKILRRKKRKIGISVIERRNQSTRRRELRTIPYSDNGKTEVDSEYATTDNEEHLQEQSNQDKSYFDSEK